jgi:hypothetical protein
MLTHLNEELAKTTPNDKFPILGLHPAQILTWIDAVWETWRVFSFPPNTAKPTSKAPDAHWGALPRVGVTLETAGPPPVFTVEFSEALLAGLDLDIRVANGPGKTVPGPVAVAAKNVLQSQLANVVSLSTGGSGSPPGSFQVPFWKQMMYAYLVENTHAVEIMRRVLQLLVTDETLGPMSPQAYQWLRLTEDLFFRDGPTSLVGSLTSWIRPDFGATRRNAYYRFFAMDLNHGGDDGKPYPYVKPTIANSQFVRVLQDLLRELWRGFTNATNQIGPNTTDDSAIGELIDQLQTMLTSRRLSDGGHGNLAREELVSVTMMSWFELSVGQGSPIVSALKATADTREDQLSMIGERVKVPVYAKSRALFLLADNLPALLSSIEAGFYDASNRANVQLLYKIPGAIRDSVLAIITYWGTATGVNVKEPPATAPR